LCDFAPEDPSSSSSTLPQYWSSWSPLDLQAGSCGQFPSLLPFRTQGKVKKKKEKKKKKNFMELTERQHLLVRLSTLARDLTLEDTKKRSVSLAGGRIPGISTWERLVTVMVCLLFCVFFFVFWPHSSLSLVVFPGQGSSRKSCCGKCDVCCPHEPGEGSWFCHSEEVWIGSQNLAFPNAILQVKEKDSLDAMIKECLGILVKTDWGTYEAVVGYCEVLSLVHRVLKGCRKKQAEGGAASQAERLLTGYLSEVMPAVFGGFYIAAGQAVGSRL